VIEGEKGKNSQERGSNRTGEISDKKSTISPAREGTNKIPRWPEPLPAGNTGQKGEGGKKKTPLFHQEERKAATTPQAKRKGGSRELQGYKKKGNGPGLRGKSSRTASMRRKAGPRRSRADAATADGRQRQPRPNRLRVQARKWRT